ncbi:MAG TPA: D-aminoacyl-tRNA deacylase [Phycisphaerales bacterium]|nr:D-aminoacyl-tRNA deacylase [Phycisphaerales bacterium]
MKAIVQRVSSASVEVDGKVIGEIALGLVVLAAVEESDTESECRWMAEKLVNLRIFPDEAGKMNRSLLDVGGSMLLISNFTVAGECSKGRRPSFDRAMKPPRAKEEFDHLLTAVRALGIPVETGEFGADMRVRIVNEGPVTLIVSTEPRSAPVVAP